MQILWEDAFALVVNKPPARLTQGPPGIDTVETRLRAMLAERDPRPVRPYTAMVHRLDRPVSGALLVARNQRAAKRLGAQFATRKVDKRYLAVVEGDVTDASGTWEDWMRKIPERPVAEIVDRAADGARHAVLHYERLAAADGLALLAIRLETGRMHQIRLQAGHRGHPVLGEWLYGDAARPFGPQAEDARGRWIALHAWRLTFRHPKTAVAVTVAAPPPRIWAELPVAPALPVAVEAEGAEAEGR